MSRIFSKKIKLLQNLRVTQQLFKRNEMTRNQTGTSTYEGDGKTTAQVLNKDIENGLMINSISKIGFRLNNEMLVIGPMVIFPRTVMSWNIDNFEEIDEKTLCLFPLLEPKIDLLVVGIGDQQASPKFQKNILTFMKKYNINVEVLHTEAACTTYNFLASESRMVAAALIPPQNLIVTEDDFAKFMIDRQHILEIGQ